MIGFYNYSVILTYLSLISASVGISISLMGDGHPFAAMFLLLFCALCDSFDGKVARMKKDRTETEKNFGIQIDSLTDVIAFGVLPSAIGASILFQSEYMFHLDGGNVFTFLYTVAAFAIMAFFSLAALIRLAYFNVTEEERQKTEGGVRKYYLGLPVTLGALLIPIPFAVNAIIDKLSGFDTTYIYFIGLLLVGIAFISKFHIRKPGLKEMAFMITFGTVELAAIILSLVL